MHSCINSNNNNTVFIAQTPLLYRSMFYAYNPVLKNIYNTIYYYINLVKKLKYSTVDDTD